MRKIIFLIGMICFLVTSVISRANAQWFLFENPMLGKEAVDFTLSSVKGQVKSLSELRGDGSVVLLFWTTWCPNCLSTLQMLNERKEEFLSRNIRVVLVDFGETTDVVRNYLNQENIQFDSLLDFDNEVAADYDVKGIPTFVLIDARGIIKNVGHGLPNNYEAILFGGN